MQLLEDYRADLRGKKPPRNSRHYGKSSTLAQSTIRNKLNTIKCFLKYCNLIHDIGLDFRRIDSPRAKHPPIEHITREQFSLLIDHIHRTEKNNITRIRNELLMYVGFSS